MARRKRRKGNPLLTRILLISVIVHIIALPIAAHYGAFKNIRKSFGDSHIVMLANNLRDNPEKEKAKEKAKKIENKKANSNSKATGKSKGDNLPRPKVVTSGPAAGDGSGSGPSAESGTGTAGKVPDVPKTQPKTEPVIKKDPTPDTNPIKKPDPPKVDPPKTDPVKPVEPKARKIIEAAVIEAPEPEIPDDLRGEPLDKTLVVEAEIDTGGHPINVGIASSTGIKELDRIGLETAKKYRFKPATVNGVANNQHVRFRIIFKVE